MDYTGFLTIFAFLMVSWAVGYTWGKMERGAEDIIEEVQK
jgi:hypothetical protein